MNLVIDCFKLVKGAGKSIGIYNLTRNLVNNLANASQRPKEWNLIILGNHYNREDFCIEGAEFIEIPYNPFSKVRCIWWELFQVVSICKRKSADCVLFPRGFAPISRGKNVAIIVHDLIPFYYKDHYPEYFNKLENFYIMRRLLSSIKRADQVITVSEYSKEDIICRIPKAKKHVTVIHNGLNKINMKNITVQDNDYILGMTSNLPHKNAEGIIRSYEKYCSMTSEPLPLKIIGIEDIEKYALSDRVKSNIQLYQFIKDDNQLYSLVKGAKAFLFLSFIEGFGFPPLEAMQLGVPVVCSERTSLSEVVGNAAVLVDPEDINNVALRLLELLQDKQQQIKLIECGYKNEKRFEWDSIANSYWRVLSKKNE